jgi:hypothetical protein
MTFTSKSRGLFYKKVRLEKIIWSITWTVYGKLQEIARVPTSADPASDILYFYDATGNGLSKGTTYPVTDYMGYAWYVRDAQGNLLNVYSDNSNT